MKWFGRIPAWLSVAVAGYAVVGVFGVTFWTVRSKWPNLDLRTMLMVAFAVAAPLGLGLVWQRLVTLKLFGVEVALSRVTVSIDEKISAVLSQQQYFSGSQHLIDQLRGAIVNPELKLIEVNLHSQPYWWSTRLFLLAVLAHNYSNVAEFVFVEGGTERIYVGMVSPLALRMSLATQFPELEATYQQVQQRVLASASSPADQVGAIVHEWTASQFKQNNLVLSEEAMKTLVTRQLLSSWLTVGNGKLETDYLTWDGGPDSALLSYMVIRRSSPYVALVRERRLEKVVDRIDLALRVAENALRHELL